MYNQLKSQVENEFFKILLISLGFSLALVSIYHYKVVPTILGVLFVNITLFAAYWYTTLNNRPILFVTLFVFYLGLGLYTKRNLENMTEATGLIAIIFQRGSSTILLLGCLTIIILEIKNLVSVVKSNVDLWIPPLWSLVLVIFLILEYDDSISSALKRISILVLIVGLILVSFYKNNNKQPEEVYFNITLKGYSSHLTVMILIIILGVMILPKLEYLPGAKWLQQFNKALIGDLPSEITLNRNPPQSDQILFEVTSEEPIYLREIAYSYYEKGSWSIDTKEQAFRELDEKVLAHESEWLTELNSQEEADVYEDKQAYICEVKENHHFLTINGLTHIETNEDTNIVYYGDINNICFKEKQNKGQVGYTINYRTMKEAYEDNFAHKGPKDRRDLENQLYKQGIDVYVDSKEPQLYLDSRQYAELRTRYTQVPEDLSQDIFELARNTCYGMESDTLAAQAIENLLKNSGEFTYKIGAKQNEPLEDPVYDFLFRGREGICQDFASGMVLLCRSLGMPTRYVTGYYSNELDEKGKYIVRAKHAHAFVEVYISGYGWKLFDPTPQANSLDNSSSEGNGNIGILPHNEQTSDLIAAGQELLGALLVLVIIIVGVKGGAYLYWRSKLFTIPTNEAITQLTRKLLRLLETKECGLQEGETLGQLTLRLKSLNIDVSPITVPFENHWYGHKKIDSVQVTTAFECYKELKKTTTTP